MVQPLLKMAAVLFLHIEIKILNLNLGISPYLRPDFLTPCTCKTTEYKKKKCIIVHKKVTEFLD